MTNSLAGIHVWCTRPGRAGEKSCRRMFDEGARVTHAPTVRIEPRGLDEPTKAILREKAASSVVALTSPAGAENFVRAARGIGPEGTTWRVAAVGERTALRARELGLAVAFTSPRSTAADFGPALLAACDAPVILLPGSNLRRGELADTLTRAGREVLEFVVQETRPLLGLPAGVRSRLEEIDLLVAFSPSALGFVESLDAETLVRVVAIPVAAMGPTTAGRARELGFEVQVAPEDPHEDRLLADIRRWAATRA